MGIPVALAIIRDISERKRAETALRQANRQLNLLSGITQHDINNQIMIILAYLEMAKSESDNPTMEQFWEKIDSATRGIQSQIEFMKIYQDLGSHEPQWQELEMIVSLLPVPEYITLATDVSGVLVFADPMLRKIFFNLLDNSIRHGRQVTEIRLLSLQSGDDLKIVWEDNGIGVPAGEKERIFQRGFWRNTGLGLVLIREILLITGITIKETGEPGIGARFELDVPKGAWRIG